MTLAYLTFLVPCLVGLLITWMCIVQQMCSRDTVSKYLLCEPSAASDTGHPYFEMQDPSPDERTLDKVVLGDLRL